VNIVTRRLSDKDQDDRVRIALGLTGDDPLPGVDGHTLRAYHRCLAAHLAFPFEATWEPEYGSRQAVKITGLGDPEEDAWADEMGGLLCEARAEGRLAEVPLAECEARKGEPQPATAERLLVLLLEQQVRGETERPPDALATKRVGKATPPEGAPPVRRGAGGTPDEDGRAERPVACTIGVQNPGPVPRDRFYVERATLPATEMSARRDFVQITLARRFTAAEIRELLRAG
jgi:hypothetical protein